jgi:hypothetical protein
VKTKLSNVDVIHTTLSIRVKRIHGPIIEGDSRTPFYCLYHEKIENDLHRKYWIVEKEEKVSET